jgi:hypothetical protein
LRAGIEDKLGEDPPREIEDGLEQWTPAGE